MSTSSNRRSSTMVRLFSEGCSQHKHFHNNELKANRTILFRIQNSIQHLVTSKFPSFVSFDSLSTINTMTERSENSMCNLPLQRWPKPPGWTNQTDSESQVNRSWVANLQTDEILPWRHHYGDNRNQKLHKQSLLWNPVSGWCTSDQVQFLGQSSQSLVEAIGRWKLKVTDGFVNTAKY